MGIFFRSIESNKLAPTYVATLDGAVFSVVEGLTSVFGMRTGVPLPLTHQLITFNQLTYFLGDFTCELVILYPQIS